MRDIELSMPDASHAIRDELRGVVLFIGLIWAVFLVSLIFPALTSMVSFRATSSGSWGSRQCRSCTEILGTY